MGYRDGKPLVDVDLAAKGASGDAFIDRFGLGLPVEPGVYVLPNYSDYLTHSLSELGFA